MQQVDLFQVLATFLFVLTTITFDIGCIPLPRSDGKYNKWQYSGKYQGDMVLHDPRNALRDKSKYWPNGVICYEFEGNFTKKDKKTIENALRTGFKGTCIKTRYCRWHCKGDYVAIKNDEEGCFSDVGRIGGRQEVNLGEGCVFEETVVHEFLHALGFYHEQSTPNRDDYLEIREENIEEDMLNNFDKEDPRDVTDFGQPYDYCSIMHYDEYAFTVNGEPTMVPKCNYSCDMGFVLQLSPIDVNKINIMYNCKRKWYPLRDVLAPVGCRNISTTL